MSGRRALLALFLVTLPLVTPRIRGADEIEYFSHLRSFVFDRDLEFGNEYTWFHARDPDGLAGFKTTFLDRLEPATGRHINFGPIGSAVLWAPFYLVAHVAVLVTHALGSSVPADGFSWPYAAAAAYASALYGFLGLLLTHDTLVRETPVGEPAATWSVAAIWLATPALYYMTLAPGFSHACSLFAVALLVWLWLRARRGADSVRAWMGVGAAAGLAALVREQDLLFLAAPLVDLAGRAVRDGRWRAAGARGVAAVATALVVFTPQLLAYKYINGGYGPSRLVARKMSYHSPHFFAVLIDPGHGWLVWTPLAVAAVAGCMSLLWRRRDGVALGMAVSLLLQVWINGSVESWSQAGAFGSRRFVSVTPVLALGLATLISAGFGSATRHRRAIAAGLLVCVWWNVSLMLQFGLKLMDRQRLEWPRVAINQFTEVPRRAARTAVLFFSDRERLVRETR